MRNLQLLIGVLFLCSLPPTAARASEPAGVWIVPDRVVVLPDESEPLTLQISGLATLHSGTGPVNQWGYAGFEQPRRGTLFYKCAAGQQALCKMQWHELAAALGTCIGFGSVSEATGELRAVVSPSDAPDVYPIGIGVVHGYTPCEFLAHAAPSPGEDAGSSPQLDAATPPSAAGAGAPGADAAAKPSQSPPAAQAPAGPTTPTTTTPPPGGPTTTPPPAALNAPASANASAGVPDAGRASPLQPTPVHVASGCSASVSHARPEPMAAALVLALLGLRALRRRERHGR